MPPPREVKFCIDLVTSATLVSKVPYWIAPAKLKELKAQLDELLERVYRAQYVPMGSPGAFPKKEGWDPKVVHRLQRA